MISAETMISAFGGALLTQVMAWVCGRIAKGYRRKALYSAVIAECRYNLSILDEVLHGLVDANGSFKRMSVEFFKSIRQQLIDYSSSENLLSTLSRLIVDLELFNMEANYVFNGGSREDAFLGVVGDAEVRVVRNSVRKDISETVRRARDGVEGSLNAVIKIINELGYESED